MSRIQKFCDYKRNLFNDYKNRGLQVERIKGVPYMIVTGTWEQLEGIWFQSWREEGQEQWNDRSQRKRENQPGTFKKYLQKGLGLPLTQFKGMTQRLVVARPQSGDDFDDTLNIIAKAGKFAIIESNDEWKNVSLNYKVLCTKAANSEKWWVKGQFSEKRDYTPFISNQKEHNESMAIKEHDELHGSRWTDPYDGFSTWVETDGEGNPLIDEDTGKWIIKDNYKEPGLRRYPEHNVGDDGKQK